MGRIEADIALESWLFGFRPCSGKGQFTLHLQLFTQKYCVMWKILMLEISAKKGLCDIIWGSEVKTSDLAAHFTQF